MEQQTATKQNLKDDRRISDDSRWQHVASVCVARQHRERSQQDVKLYKPYKKAKKIIHSNFIQNSDDHGFGLLHWACWDGHLSVVDILLERGSKINAVNYGNHHKSLNKQIQKLRSQSLNFFC